MEPAQKNKTYQVIMIPLTQRVNYRKTEKERRHCILKFKYLMIQMS